MASKTGKETEVFWSNESLYIRQDNDGEVDLVELDIGQAYDLLKAVSRALEIAHA